MQQTILLINNRVIININEIGIIFHTYTPRVDPSIDYGGSYHLAFAIPSVFTCLVVNVLPPLLLVLYPCRAFRSCLSKCHFDFIAVQVFIDKVYSCYRNGLDGGRDMRSFSGLYFLLRLAAYLPSVLSHLLSSYFYINEWFTIGTTFCIISLFVAFAKPYRKAQMNYLDSMLLLNCALLSFMLSTGWRMLLVARILLSTPITLLCLIIILKKANSAIKNTFKVCTSHFNRCRFRGACHTAESSQSAITGTVTAVQPLIQPTSTVFSYGADDN